MAKKYESIRQALTALPGEEAPRVEVERNNIRLNFAVLEKMTLGELTSCKVNIVTYQLVFRDIRPENILPNLNGLQLGRYAPSTPALDILERFYETTLAIFRGV